MVLIVLIWEIGKIKKLFKIDNCGVGVIVQQVKCLSCIVANTGSIPHMRTTYGPETKRSDPYMNSKS